MLHNKSYKSDIIAEIDSLPCSHPASVNLDVANYYYSLAKMIRPELIVEIGCFIGFSSMHFAQALREQGFGKLISIDPFAWELDAGNGLESQYDIALRYLQKSGNSDIIEYKRGHAETIYEEIKETIHPHIDILYIDGDHTIDGVFKDFNIFNASVKPGGIIILHDIYPEMCDELGPRVLVDTLKSTGLIPDCFELTELPTRDGFGICIIRKTCNKAVTVHIPLPSLTQRCKTKLKNALRKPENRRPPTPPWEQKSPNAGIAIQIRNKITQSPIQAAAVICPQRDDETRLADSNGMVFLQHYLPNRYIFRVTAEGYATRDNILIDVVQAAHQQIFTLEMQPIK